MTSDNSSNAIVFLFLAIGISYTSYFEISSILNRENINIDKVVSLNNINPDSIQNKTFYLTDFYYKTTDFKRLDNKNFLLLLYKDETDTIARIGVEIKDKKYFEKSFIQNKKVLVDTEGSMYKVDINGNPTLFGYGDLFSKKDVEVNLNVDQTLKSRSITLRFIAMKNFSKNWLEVLFWLFFPLLFFGLGFFSLKKAIQQREF